MNDIDTAVVDSLKVLDPERPIREATKRFAAQRMQRCAIINQTHRLAGDVGGDDEGVPFSVREGRRGRDLAHSSQALTMCKGLGHPQTDAGQPRMPCRRVHSPIAR